MAIQKKEGYLGRGGLMYPTEVAAAASIIAAADEGELIDIGRSWSKHYAKQEDQTAVREAVKILFEAVVAAEVKQEARRSWRADGKDDWMPKGS